MAERALDRGIRPRGSRDTAAAGHTPSAANGAASARGRELDHRHVGLSLTIRESRDDDAAKLEWMGLSPRQRASLDDAYARHARGDELLLVAESQGFPIALVRLALPARDDDQDRAVSIAALRVMPGLQGLGIGTALIAAAERSLRERGRAVIEIAVPDTDPKSLARYVRLGYAATQRDGEGHIVLRKLLDPTAARPLQRIAP